MADRTVQLMSSSYLPFTKCTSPRCYVAATLLLTAVGCSYSSSTGQIATGVTPSSYRYVVISAASVAIEQVAREFVNKGYVVLQREGVDRLADLDVPSGAVLFISCTYLGQTASDALGSTGANVICEAVDYASRKQVYTGSGKHTSISTEEADIKGAVRKALQQFPSTGREGTVSMVVDFPGRPAATETSSGTGFFVDSLGHVVTNAHVVDSCRLVTAGGEPLRILRVDAHNDLALLLHPVKGAALPLRTGRAVRPGDDIVVVGFPLSDLLSTQPSVTTGTISALAGLGDDTRFLQITAPVQPGSSGGPVLDRQGFVVGVVVAKLNAIAVARITGDIPQNVNFAIAGGILRNFLETSELSFGVAPPTPELSAADVGDRGRRSVVHLQCTR